jgi:methionyl-tRNA formyltransferase
MVSVTPLRIVFFGSPAFAVPTLEALLRSSHRVVGVVTQPDKPRGRGQSIADGPVKVCAVAAGVPVLQPSSLKDPAFLQQVASLRADLGVVAAYGKILPEAVIQAARLGMINVHASLLPKYRGAAPIQRAVAAGDAETGVTIMRVVKALDAGAMLATTRRPIGAYETAADVERDLARLGAALLVATVDRMARGPIDEPPQDDSQATYAPRLTKTDGLIDWSMSAREVHNLVRALHPWPHAYSFLGDRRLILLHSEIDEASVGGAPGEVLTAAGDDLRIATGRGALVVHEIQAEGRRPMGMREFLAGHAIAPGERFSSPAPGPRADR